MCPRCKRGQEMEDKSTDIEMRPFTRPRLQRGRNLNQTIFDYYFVIQL